MRALTHETTRADTNTQIIVTPQKERIKMELVMKKARRLPLKYLSINMAQASLAINYNAHRKPI